MGYLFAGALMLVFTIIMLGAASKLLFVDGSIFAGLVAILSSAITLTTALKLFALATPMLFVCGS